jgi:hypothetical protein
MRSLELNANNALIFSAENTNDVFFFSQIIHLITERIVFLLIYNLLLRLKLILNQSVLNQSLALCLPFILSNECLT